MNMLEYIRNGGLCRSASGHDFVLSGFEKGSKYPVKGFLLMNNYNYPCEWTEDGVPHNLPYSHGLNLMPVIPVVTYKMVSNQLLSRYMNIEDFLHDAEILTQTD